MQPDLSDEDIADPRQAQAGAGCASRCPYVMTAAPKRHCSYSGCPNEGTHWLEGWGADLADGWYCQTHATELTRLREEQARNRTRIWNWFKQAVGKF
jgi:hypothetical protein